jgi:hypothetical protein
MGLGGDVPVKVNQRGRNILKWLCVVTAEAVAPSRTKAELAGKLCHTVLPILLGYDCTLLLEVTFCFGGAIGQIEYQKGDEIAEWQVHFMLEISSRGVQKSCWTLMTTMELQILH